MTHALPLYVPPGCAPSLETAKLFPVSISRDRGATESSLVAIQSKIGPQAECLAQSSLLMNLHELTVGQSH